MHYEKSKVTCRLSLTQEIFEIFNNSSRPLHIGNWRVFSLTGRECFRFDAGITVPQYKALLLRSGHITDLKRKDHVEVHWCNRSIWNNSGDVAALVDGNNNVVAIVEEGRPYNNWPTDGLHATKLDETQLVLMLIHAGFEKELPANRDILTKVRLVDLYEQFVIPKVISTPKRKRAAAGLGNEESASKRFKDTPRIDRPDWQPVGHIHGSQDSWLWEQQPVVKKDVDPPTQALNDRPPWVPPGTPKQSDAWLYDPSLSQSWSVPRQSGTTPRSVPGTQMLHGLTQRPMGDGPTVEADGREDRPESPIPEDLPPKMLNFAMDATGRSISEMSISSLPDGQFVANGSPVQPLLEEEEDDESSLEPPLMPVPQPPPMAAPEPLMAVPLPPQMAATEPPAMAVPVRSGMVELLLVPQPQLQACEPFVQRQHLHRRSNAAGLFPTIHGEPADHGHNCPSCHLGDTSSVIDTLQQEKPQTGRTLTSSNSRLAIVKLARGAGCLLVWLLCVAFLGWCICLISRPSRLLCDTEKMGASRIHTDCVPCEEEGFCAQGRLWACKNKGLAREQCIKDWLVFYLHTTREHTTFWTVRVLGTAAVLWWPVRMWWGLVR